MFDREKKTMDFDENNGSPTRDRKRVSNPFLDADGLKDLGCYEWSGCDLFLRGKISKEEDFELRFFY